MIFVNNGRVHVLGLLFSFMTNCSSMKCVVKKQIIEGKKAIWVRGIESLLLDDNQSFEQIDYHKINHGVNVW